MLEGLNQPAAYFNCAMVLYMPKTDELITCEAKMDGVITFPPQGDKGFGFDPIFMPEGIDKTLAQLGDSFKNQKHHIVCKTRKQGVGFCLSKQASCYTKSGISNRRF